MKFILTVILKISLVFYFEITSFYVIFWKPKQDKNRNVKFRKNASNSKLKVS